MQLLLSTIAHHGPRRLKLGKTIGQSIVAFGEFVLVGCKRSSHLARVYMSRMMKDLCCSNIGVKPFQHVDDISNLIVGSFARQVVEGDVWYSFHFKGWTDKIKLGISSKSAAVPNNDEAKSFARIVNNIGILMKVNAKGVDIGVDTSAASNWIISKQTERDNAIVKRAKSVGTFARKGDQCQTGCHGRSVSCRFVLPHGGWIDPEQHERLQAQWSRVRAPLVTCDGFVGPGGIYATPLTQE